LVADGSVGVDAVLAVFDVDWSVFLSLAKDGEVRQTATTKAAVSDSKFFIRSPDPPKPITLPTIIVPGSKESGRQKTP
jgi:hypothetical protein